MLTFISIFLTTASVILAVAVAIVFMEICAAIALPQRECPASLGRASRQRVVVLIPAHNESTGLLPTLVDVKAQLCRDDKVLVVADNCTDDTAAIAVAAGVDVSCRDDLEKRGKGYALAWGVRQLHLDPPDIVVILDADCRLPPGTIDRIAEASAITGRPVQALYLMVAPKEAPSNYRAMEFAWRIKNWIRPLGLMSVGLPCQLMGTGMAFPWDVIRSANLASGSIVEDLKLGLELALTRNPPLFCHSAVVTSEFPSSAEGIASQRLRWEQGHIGMIWTAIPHFILTAIKQQNVHLLALALDAAVPPLSLLGILVIGMVAISGFSTALGVPPAALVISTASLLGFIGAIVLSWLKFGRDLVPRDEILPTAFYVIKKFRLYFMMLLSRNSARQWIRTDRSKT